MKHSLNSQDIKFCQPTLSKFESGGYQDKRCVSCAEITEAKLSPPIVT